MIPFDSIPGSSMTLGELEGYVIIKIIFTLKIKIIASRGKDLSAQHDRDLSFNYLWVDISQLDIKSYWQFVFVF